MDVLSRVLDSLSIESTISCNAQLSAPWGLRFDAWPTASTAVFGLVIRGSAYLELDGVERPISVRGGDMVLLPGGTGHTLRDSTDSGVVRIQDILPCATHDSHAVFSHGGGGSVTNLLAGRIFFKQHQHNPLLSSFPAFIHVRAEDGKADPWLESSIRFMASEALNGGQGAHLIVSRLSEIIFAQAMRHFMREIEHCPESTGWLKALTDPQLARAFTLMHDDPASPWTVAALAEHVGVSRSAFADKFADVTGTTPMQYLTDWRMHCAERMMADASLNLSEIAMRVGYNSEAAFSKAFKRERGLAPGAFRSGLADVEVARR